jgi:signal transduction histidine kinase
VRAFFPVSSYAPQDLSYSFTITPPWWDTWWSKIVMLATFVGIIVLVIRFYYRRKLQKQRILFEKQQAVEQERTRIAMEMHDDLGSGLTTIRYLAGGLSLQSGNSSKDKAEKIASSAKSLVDNMNDIIWTMKSDNNSLNETLAYIRKQAAEQLETAGIDYHIDFPKDPPVIKLSNELKRNLLLISKEAIHNIVKHSAATNVYLTAHLDTNQLQLKIVDNGKGIDLTDISRFGNGLKSMRKRAEEIRALLEVMNAEGTTIVVTAPV